MLPEPDIDADRPAVKSENDAGEGQLIPAAFLRRVVGDVVAGECGARRGMNHQARGRLAKFWYGPDGNIHYEIAIHERIGRIELGLHFESTPDHNRALYKAFDSCMLEIQESLGSSFWLENWDRGWVRLYETHPLYPLDSYRVGEIVTRLEEIINTLQPLYEQISSELDVLALRLRK